MVVLPVRGSILVTVLGAGFRDKSVRGALYGVANGTGLARFGGRRNGNCSERPPGVSLLSDRISYSERKTI